MNRYVFYNFILVSFINLMLYVPHILIQYRYTGAVSSIAAGSVIGTVLLYLYTSALARYPGKGLPEILKIHFPGWPATVLTLFFAIMWWFATTVVVVAYAILINRFFNPDVNTTVILLTLVLACGYAATRSTLTVMFVIEIGVIINAPIIMFILFKAVRSPQLNWDAIRVVANYITAMPSITALAAASFVFTGYINLSLFNRLFPPNFRFKFRWVYPTFGLAILLVTFFVPIGFHGTETVNRYIYIWSVTADSLLMQYGFIERVLFLFLIVFLNLTLVYTMSGCHQAMEFIKSCLPGEKAEIDSPETPVSNYVIVSCFALLTMIFQLLTNEKLNMQITSYWLVLRMFIEFFSVIGIFILSRRRSRAV
ncbi:GerAB/ArcD/ProY family transporter [Paenibacillus sp. N4]|uniref:GerAB/ArcD/ProY family transporter n=1 Tax=Paenibacillus vietnamensis TaxID=2590547 RepID=UPI001CD0562B|nr:GerAB/ArcD/ProY family transporter [Paenibacillus vietnamensis]MCA0755315.1 GerAB/ArcD/ProY family transporter [Paenibacillus vietnamensis]